MKPHSPDFCNKVVSGNTWLYGHVSSTMCWPEYASGLTYVELIDTALSECAYTPIGFTFCLCAWICADSPDVDWLFSCGSWLTNPRRPSSPCGSGLGEVGQLFYSDLSLTRNLYISSKWARLVVFSAWFGAIATTITLFGLDSQGLAEGMVSHSTLHTL